MKSIKILALATFLTMLIHSAIAQVKINGFLQYMYRADLKENKVEGNFTPGTMNLKFSGSLDKNVRWEVQFGLKETSFNKFLKDYYIEIVDLFPNIKGLKFRFGQFKYLWSVERNESSSDRKTILRSQVVSALVADRDRGIEISYSGIESLHLAIGLWNGEVVFRNHGTIFETIDYTRNLDDSDARKDIAGFIGYELKFNDENFVALNGSFLFGSNGRMNIRDKKRYGLGVDAFFVNKNLHFRSELVSGNDDEIKKFGYYLQVSYRFFDYFEPVFKYEIWDNDLNATGESNWFTFGIYSKILKNVVFRVNYVKKDEKPIEIRNDELMFMIQTTF